MSDSRATSTSSLTKVSWAPFARILAGAVDVHEDATSVASVGLASQYSPHSLIHLTSLLRRGHNHREIGLGDDRHATTPEVGGLGRRVPEGRDWPR